MAGSVVVQVRSWLVDQLKALGDLDGVEVLYSWPTVGEEPDRFICTGPAEAEVSMPTFRAGTQRRLEEFVVPVALSVKAPGASQQAADTDAVALLTVLEEWFARTDVVQAVGALGADQQVTGMQLIGWRQLGGVIDPPGHGAGFELSVRIVARSL